MEPPNKRMKQTSLSAARGEMEAPLRAPHGRVEGRTGSQLIRSVRRTGGGRVRTAFAIAVGGLLAGGAGCATGSQLGPCKPAAKSSLEVRLIDGSGQPVADERVSVTNLETGEHDWAKPGDSGAETFTLGPGRYLVEVGTGHPWKRVTTTCRVPEGCRATASVRMRGGPVGPPGVPVRNRDFAVLYAALNTALAAAPKESYCGVELHYYSEGPHYEDSTVLTTAMLTPFRRKYPLALSCARGSTTLRLGPPRWDGARTAWVRDDKWNPHGPCHVYKVSRDWLGRWRASEQPCLVE
jgi:hypothetical protein